MLSCRPMPSTARRLQWLLPLALLGGVSAAVFLGVYLVDWAAWSHAAKPGPLAQFFGFDPDTAQNALGNLAQVIAAVLGIVITVVSIVVQLAATRYTPRIADMFFRDRTNLIVLGVYVVAGIDAVWVSLSVTRDFVPRFSIACSLVLVTVSVLLTVPYFAYVFDFLDPVKVVARIQRQALASALSALDDRDSDGALAARQLSVLRSVEQLTDVAMNAVAQKDKLIAQGAIDALSELAARFVEQKGSAPAAWFALGPELRSAPDFVAMGRDAVDALATRRQWLEWKVLRQLQAIYDESLSQLPDVAYLVAIDTRYVGDRALAARDPHLLRLVVKFLNTYLRASLNAGQVRAAYNVLNQYRQLCEHLIEANIAGEAADERDRLVTEIAGYFRYYGQLAEGKNLGFITETAAHDLAALCERAFLSNARCHDALLRVLLTLDRPAENGEQEYTLRGVRKAQARLATFYLVHGAELSARQIAADFRDEPAARLRLIHDELLAVTSPEFWEVVDRGSNFEYLDAARRAQLAVFFSWFSDAGLGSSVGGRLSPIERRDEYA